MTKDEALKLALEALEVCQQSNYGRDWVWPDTAHEQAMKNVAEAITAIKEALPQPEQEPVAWMVYTRDGQSVYVTDNPTDIQENQRALPLYTTPPQRTWVGLTDEEINTVAYNNHPLDGIRTFAKAIEAALRSKNNA